MSTRRILLVVVAVSAAVLAIGIGPGRTGTAQALPLPEKVNRGQATIPYSGELTDPAGRWVADGLYDFSFALYAAESGGDPLWSEVQEGVAVKDGGFAVFLGSVALLPADRLAGKGTLWLAVGVRGPSEAAFTTLAPRQRLTAAAPTVSDSTTAGAACPHDHFGESWVGTGSDGLLVATNNWTGLTGWSDSYLGVAGISTPYTMVWPSGRSYGVLGYSYSDHGVYGRTNGDWSYHSGVYGEASKDHASGVTGWNTGGGTGVYGYSETGNAADFRGSVLIRGHGDTVDSEAFEVQNSAGQMSLAAWDDGSVAIGRLSGTAAAHICSRIVSADIRNLFAACSSAAEYVPTVDRGLGFPEAGDLVSIVPTADDPYDDAHAPFAVAKATSAYDPNLVGFISDPALGADGIKLNEHYLPLAIYGYFPLKVTMHNGSIRRGDPITSSPQPGYGMKATRPGRIVGYALEDADREGTIQVVVQVGDHLGDAPARLDKLEAEVLAAKQEREQLLAQNADLEARLAALEVLLASDAGKNGR
jgi:hypothetical protein